MLRKLLLLTVVAAVLGPVGEASAADPLTVLSGQELTIDDTQTYTTLDVVGGTLIIDPGAVLTFEERSIIDGVGSTVIMNGGTCHVLGDDAFERLTIGGDSEATFIQNGGFFRVGNESSPGDAGDTKLGDNPAHDPNHLRYMYLNGGVFRTHRMEVDGGGDLGNRGSNIIIGGGTLIVEDVGEGAPSDWTDVLCVQTGEFILRPAEGYIGLVIEDFNDGEIITAILGPAATSPSPEDAAENACPETVLTWTAGPNTQPTNGHQVYFGTSFDDVNNATTSAGLGVYQGAQSGASFDPSPDLALNTTYYWRVDQVNDVEAWSPWKGKVWSFTTNDGNAFDPDPEDGEIKVVLDKVLSWTPGCGATLHDVYFSTDFDAVDTLNVSARVENDYAGTTYNPGGLDFLVDYYWRVVEDNTYVGPVWHFQAKSAIVDPNMKLWYEFNETDGNTVSDSSGFQNPGDISGYYEGIWNQIDSADGGGSISMNGSQGIDIHPDFLLEMPTTEISVSLWAKGARNVGENNWMFSIGGAIDNFPYQWNLGAAVPSDSGGVLFIAGREPYEWDDVTPTEADSNDILEWTSLEGASPSGWEDDWHHFVFMKNETEGTMSIYFDGLLAEQRSGVLATLGEVRGKVDELKVGAYWGNDSDYVGQLDDLRIFSYALSDEDVASLFRRGDLDSAWGPKPSNGAGDVPRDANLTWLPGDTATHHDVYFGTSFDDVNDAGTVSGEYEGRLPVGSELYNPTGDLELGKTYYWRIDEVNEANSPDDLYKGKVWKFTVANFVVLDNFESYDQFVNRIWHKWDNPWGTGSFIELGVAPFAPVYGGSQSMEYLYDNATKWDFFSYWSETEYNFDTSVDFTAGSLKALTLYFYGDAGNDIGVTEQISVGLEGTSRVDVDLPDMNDLLVTEWHEWNITLSDFAAAGLTAIDAIYLKFGDSSNTDTPGGDGIVYFDDIRLYPPKCVPEFGPTADLSENCVVDFADVRILGEQWLRTDTFISVSAPAASPIAHWTLDDGSGSTALDSGPNFLNGTLEGDYLWVAGHVGSGAVDFSGGRVLVPDAVVLRSMSQLSVMAWIYSEQGQSSARVVVKGADNKESYELEVNGETDVDFVVRENSDPCQESFVRHDVSYDNLVLNEWIHIAGTYDSSTMKLYINGQDANSNSVGSFTISQDPNGLGIGNRSDAYDRAFVGTIDDVRVYSTALSEAEIAYVATQGTGYVPLQSLANLYDGESAGDKAINFRDYAVIMSSWLEEKLWPLP